MTWIGRQTRQRKFDPRESLGGTSIAKHRMVRTRRGAEIRIPKSSEADAAASGVVERLARHSLGRPAA